MFSGNRIIIICGHYGSGKTNIAVNLALELKKSRDKVTIIDLDIVNPYFRTADNKAVLEKAGIRCILPEFANSNVDIPSIPSEVYSVFESEETAIFDVGGDEDGAVALAMFGNEINKVGYEMLCVFNMYRPLTSTPDEVIGNMIEIENRCGLHFTSLVNNSNLEAETTAQTVEDSLSFADEVAEKTKLPLLFTSHIDDFSIRSEKPVFAIKDRTKKIYK